MCIRRWSSEALARALVTTSMAKMQEVPDDRLPIEAFGDPARPRFSVGTSTLRFNAKFSS